MCVVPCTKSESTKICHSRVLKRIHQGRLAGSIQAAIPCQRTCDWDCLKGRKFGHPDVSAKRKHHESKSVFGNELREQWCTLPVLATAILSDHSAPVVTTARDTKPRNMSQIVFFMLGINHLVACGFYGLADLEQETSVT